MGQDVTIREFEAMLTTRVLAKRMNSKSRARTLREKIKYNEFLHLALIEGVGLLNRLNLGRTLRLHKSKDENRLFLVNQNERRIIGEVGINFDKMLKGQITRPRIIIVSKYRLPKTINELAFRKGKGNDYKIEISKR